MPLLVHNITTALHEQPDVAIERALAVLGQQPGGVRSAALYKTSVDARKRHAIKLVHTVLVEGENERDIAARFTPHEVSYHAEPQPPVRVPGPDALLHPPVVIGMGPAGLFAAYELALCGLCPVVIERGGAAGDRTQAVQRYWRGEGLDPNSNVQFGEGGAGLFSDGKLTTRIGDPRTRQVLSALVQCGAPPEVALRAKPHLGTDNLQSIVVNLRERIIALGGQVHFNTALIGLITEGGRLAGVSTSSGDLPCEVAVLATGHSARDVFGMLNRGGIELSPKPFSVGLRIEHRQSDIDAALFGAAAGHPLLGRGEYQLSLREGGSAVYTFCMCPGGVVVPAASEDGGAVTNGMSHYARDCENANSAVVVSVDSADYGPGWDAGIRLQQELERRAFVMGGGSGRAPAQAVGEFLGGVGGAGGAGGAGRVQPSYALGVRECDLSALLPQQVTDMLRRGLVSFGRKLRGFDAPGAMLTGPETRTSSPVRVPRGPDTLEATALQGLYPCGEGAGYAGGIVSAAVDGLRVAEAIGAAYHLG